MEARGVRYPRMESQEVVGPLIWMLGGTQLTALLATGPSFQPIHLMFYLLLWVFLLIALSVEGLPALTSTLKGHPEVCTHTPPGRMADSEDKVAAPTLASSHHHD